MRCDPGLAGLSGFVGQLSLALVDCICIVVGGGFDAIGGGGGGGDDVTTLDSIELHSTKVFCNKYINHKI